MTPRLRLVPYDEAALALAVEDQAAAARAIGAVIAAPTFWEHRFMSKIYAAKLAMTRREPEAWLLSTYWQIIPAGTPSVVVGTVGFKGPPINGLVEIGYGLQPPYRHLGYMSEAVPAMCEFAFGQGLYPVGRIFAATERGNIASQKVLKKCGFEFSEQRNGLYIWIRRKHTLEINF